MPPKPLALPALEVVDDVGFGAIRHVIAPAMAAKVVGLSKVPVSARRTADLYALENGDKIVVTERKAEARPEEADGVLRIEADGTTTWLSHRRLDVARERISSAGWEAERDAISKTWGESFRYRRESRNTAGDVVRLGLRPPQIGALHAIAAHWSLGSETATVVMPTGTGKTETMLATLVAQVDGPLLVIVPSRALRDQTARKFATLGLLGQLGCLGDGVRNPVVGIVEHRPRSEEDLKIFARCNVVIGTISALGQGTASVFIQPMASKVSTLMVDEAHHVAAQSWSDFRQAFDTSRVLQFTATPHRRDGQLVEGKVIFTYPLGAAQADGYFKPITFEAIHEIDDAEGDVQIAKKAIEQLRKDLAAGRDHLVMARCESIARAEAVHAIYAAEAGDRNPVLVHSEMNASAAIERVRRRESRVVVCVDMLGEGFDLPQLKIAAVHDTHKSLAVLLQFTGRFTRVAGNDIGDATVIANTANQDVSAALERLYSEDADWNKLLREFSSQAVKDHADLIEFLNKSRRLDADAETKAVDISHHLLRPKFSVVTYTANAFSPKKFHEGLSPSEDVRAVWLHEASRTLYFVTLDEPTVDWTRAKDVNDRLWNLYVLHHDTDSGLLYVHSSDKSSTHERLAKAVSGDHVHLISGEPVFRVLGGISRLVLQTVGVSKHGRRNLRYAMFSGADVGTALTQTESGGSVKRNLMGAGWEEGQPVRIGCSAKGRVWSVENGTIPEFVRWCKSAGKKLQDSTMDTSKIFGDALVAHEVTTLPAVGILSVEWPLEIIRQSEERVVLSWGETERSLWGFDILCDDAGRTDKTLEFRVSSHGILGRFKLELGPPDGFTIRQTEGARLTVRVGRVQQPLDEYLSGYPPLVRFVDMSELDGELLLKPKNAEAPTLREDCFEPWDWTGTDIGVESIWRGGQRRPNSIQERVARHYVEGGFSVVFDDDDPGEAADLVCFKEEDDKIRLALVHCKFSGGQTAGARVKDLVEVAAQAVRSSKRAWKFKELCRHLLLRDKNLPRPGDASRFIKGDSRAIHRLDKASRFKRIATEIVIAQPGLSLAGRSADQNVVLASAQSFLKQTIDVDLDIICSP